MWDWLKKGVSWDFPATVDICPWGHTALLTLLHLRTVACPRFLVDTSHRVGVDKEGKRGASSPSTEILDSHCSLIFIIGLNITLKQLLF